MSAYKPWQPDYQLAYGNNNASALRSIESLIPSGDTGFYPMQGYSGYDDGIESVRQDGLLYISGYPSAVWVFSVMTRKQYQYLVANFTVGGSSLSGYVTVRTPIKSGVFTNHNGVILLPKLTELNRTRTKYKDVAVHFARLVAI